MPPNDDRRHRDDFQAFTPIVFLYCGMYPQDKFCLRSFPYRVCCLPGHMVHRFERTK